MGAKALRQVQHSVNTHESTGCRVPAELPPRDQRGHDNSPSRGGGGSLLGEGGALAGSELGALCRVCINLRPCLGVAAPEAGNSCLLGVRLRSSPPAPPPSLLLGKCDLSQATFNYSHAVFGAHR